jgi:hypothetical protein
MTYAANGKGPATCNAVYPAGHYVLPLVVWLVLGVAIYVTVRLGRRAPMAFAIIITGLAFGTILVLVPFVGAGAWLLLRAWRTQKYGSPTARSPVEGYVRPPPRAGRAGPRTRSTAASQAKSASSRGAKAGPPARREAPSANKRYTPKAPPRKRPPPPE